MYEILKLGGRMAQQIDLYLKRILEGYDMSYLDDYFELYNFVHNDNLRKIFAIYHTQLNTWITTINNDIQTKYDEDGNPYYSGGYFHAQDSRNYLVLLEEIDKLRSKLSSTEYAFQISNNDYDDYIRRTRRFVVKSGGSTIPESFPPIEIVDLAPIFRLKQSISVEHDKKIVHSNLRPIGGGSYAQVLSYIEPVYNIPIALKRAKPDLDNKEIIRFKQEFDTLKQLKSPYIVEVYSYNEKSNEYTMECMDENIYEFIKRENSKLTLQFRKRIIAQICRGLKYIHNKGLLHRDISLTNIFVKHYDDTDIFKIGDFGLVKIPESNLTSLDSELKGSLNDPDLVNVGFAKYEMCHEIFALTRLYYYILTGKTNINKQKEGKIKQFWNKGTSVDKAQRYNSVDELLVAIQSITEENM